MSKEYRFIGKTTPRMAASEFVTGKAKYIRDIKLPHMLYGKVLRSPYPHALIKNIETSKAETLPGVKAVLTYKNAPDWMYGNPMPHIHVLDSKVRYVGDAVALVAAETEEIAEAALDLIAVEYEQLPAVYDIEEAMKPNAPLLYYSEFKNNIVPKPPPDIQGQDIAFGDVEKGFKEADVVAEGAFSVENFQNPLPPEGPGAIAEWKDGKLTVWASIQGIGINEITLRQALRLPPGSLRLIATYCGGSYGSKHTISGPIFFTSALAQATGRPVSLCLTKEEHFASYRVRMGSRGSYKVGMKKDGTVTAVKGEWLANAGANVTLQQWMISVGLEALPMIAKCSNVDLETKVLVTNTIPSGSYRGFGYLENTCLLSSVLSMAMEQANLDPVEYYKRNCLKPGDKFFHPYMGKGWEVSAAPDITEAIEKGAELFGWKKKWKGWSQPTVINGPKRRGVGIGVSGHSDVGEQESNSIVQLNADGSVTVYCSATEFGAGTRDVLRKIAAEMLNLPLESVKVTPPDSLIGPWEWGSTGARSTYAMGTAVSTAAEEARQKLFKRAAPILNAKPEELGTRDGMVYVKGGRGEKLPWIAVIGWQGVVIGEGHFPGRYNLPTYQIHFVEVEIDVETGRVQPINFVSSTDCGQIIDPLMIQGQMQGFVPGLDLALMEESIMDKSKGYILNPNMIDYKWRTFLDLPNFQSVILETPVDNANPKCPFNARGIGEIALAPAGPAVLMALYNAIGKRFFEYPVTPDKILNALGKRP